MKTIPLTRGKVTVVDDEDFNYLNQWKWHANRKRDLFYACRSVAYRDEANEFKVKHILMHRVLMNARKGKMIDHRNRNGLDNQRMNLRFATPAQNIMNKRKSLNKKHNSKFKGTSWNQWKNKWCGDIRLNGHLTHLGYFVNEIDAAIAYDKAALKLFGEFARPNILMA